MRESAQGTKTYERILTFPHFNPIKINMTMHKMIILVQKGYSYCPKATLIRLLPIVNKFKDKEDRDKEALFNVAFLKQYT